MSGKKAGTAILIYDAQCPVCRNAVRWIRDNARKDAFEPYPCQSEDLPERFPGVKRAVCMQAMQLVLPDGSILSGEQALPEVLRRLRRYHHLARFFDLPGSESVSRAFYRWFAENRYHIARVFFPGEKKE
ncbi:MAG: DUF393 domain-containing protein [Nitrospirota bacterium]|jgi:predicted DCC family thiol-disulfide oxidoreductase YuxK